MTKTEEQPQIQQKKNVRDIMSYPKRTYTIKHGNGSITLSGYSHATPGMDNCIDLFNIEPDGKISSRTIPMQNIIK